MKSVYLVGSCFLSEAFLFITFRNSVDCGVFYVELAVFLYIGIYSV